MYQETMCLSGYFSGNEPLPMNSFVYLFLLQFFFTYENMMENIKASRENS